MFRRRASFFVVLILYLVVFSYSAAFAAESPYQQLQHPFYDPNSCTSGGDSTSATPGKGAPDGAAFPKLEPAAMASAIDKWIAKENPNSRMKGLGATIVDGAKNSNINPFLIVAIAHEESSLSDPSDFNVSHGNNSFGRSATSSQPNFSGARLWYKWSSVKASVDYTAPENKDAAGGGDIAAYLRAQYSRDVDSGSITSLFLKYAPPGENNTTEYIANVKNWIKDLIALSGSSSPASDAATGDSGDSCSADSGGSAVSGDAIKTALGYAWPTYHPADYCTERESYKAAILKAKANGEYTGGDCDAAHVGIDCGGFVTRVMRDSGVDKDYNRGNGNTVTQQAYLDEMVSKGKYMKVSASSTADLQPGDIAINDHHTYMYVGKQTGFNGNSASASFGSWRAPMASAAYGIDGEFTWYRLK